MDNPVIVDEEDIPLINQHEDYGNYRTPDKSRMGESWFTVPNTSGETSTLQLRQKVKLDKITAFYRHLNVTGNPDLEACIDL